MKHLNEDILIQYQFNLLSNAARQETASHLADCEQCRQTLTALQRKFSALDVLNAEEELPQELVAKTLTRCTEGTGGKSAFRWWARPTLLTAAAAVAVVGFLWLREPKEPAREAPPQVAVLEGTKDKQFASKTPAEQGLSANDALLGDRGRSGKAESFADADSAAAKPAASRAMSTLMPVQEPVASVRVVNTEDIPEKPPFAPASAIELVVLPSPENMQVTIYNSADLTLVRDTRKLVLKPGWNWLQFMWAGTKIDPTSLSLRPLEYADRVNIEQLVFPPRVRELGRWLIRSEVEGAVPFEITYFTSGLHWRAAYEGTLDTNETTMDLKGYVRVENNAGQDYVNTQTRLLLGQVRLLDQIAVLAARKYAYGPDVANDRLDYFFADEKSKGVDLDVDKRFGGGMASDFSWGFAIDQLKKDIEKQGLSEYFLYTIEGKENLPDTWGKRLESLDVSGIQVKSLYKYDEQRYGNQTVRFVSFKNDTEHELGETPLPEGNIRIFRDLSDAEHLSYVGQSAFKYIPVNEDVELNMGGSQLVKVEPKLMDSKTANHTFDKDNNVNGWDEIETWQIKMTNTRDIPADIEITREFGTDYWELQLVNPKSEIRNPKQIQNANDSMTEAIDVDYKKYDKRRARFTATIEPHSEGVFGYVVTKYQGQRSEYYVQKEKEQ